MSSIILYYCNCKNKPEGKILHLDSLLVELICDITVHLLYPVIESDHHGLDPRGGVVQRLDEEVPDVRHQVCEAEEAVSLGVLPPLPGGVRGQHVVDWPDDLIHPLDVALARVELGVEEEDPLDDLPVGLLARLHDGVVVLYRLLLAV